MPCDDIELSQPRLQQWLVAWRHQAIIWTNFDLSSVRLSDIYLRAFSHEIPQPSTIKISLKIVHLQFYSNISGSNIKQFMVTSTENENCYKSGNQSHLYQQKLAIIIQHEMFEIKFYFHDK